MDGERGVTIGIVRRLIKVRGYHGLILQENLLRTIEIWGFFTVFIRKISRTLKYVVALNLVPHSRSPLSGRDSALHSYGPARWSAQL